MELPNKIRLSNLYNFSSNSNSIKVLEVELYSGSNKININNITINTSYTGFDSSVLNNLLVPNNDIPVEIPSSIYDSNRGSFYIDLEITEEAPIAKLIFVRFKSTELIYWVSKFDINAVTPSSGNIGFILGSTPITTFPGENSFPPLPSFPANYDNGTIGWEAPEEGSRFVLTQDGSSFIALSVPSGTSARYEKIKTKLPIVEGNWYFEFRTNYTFDIGFCSDLYILDHNNTLGSDLEGQSLGFFMPNNVKYKNKNKSDQELYSLLIDSLNFTHSLENGFYIKNLPTKDYLYYFAIDTEKREASLVNSDGTSYLTLKIPWNGPIYLVLGVYDTGYVYNNRVSLGHRNYYHPFNDVVINNLGLSEKTFKYGFGEDLSYKFPETDLSIVLETGKVLKQSSNVTQDSRSNLINLSKATNWTIGALPENDREDLLKNYTLYFFDVETNFTLGLYRGFGYFKSNVLKGIGNHVPIRTTVALLDVSTDEIILTTISDPDTGEFEFKFVSEWRLFNILAYDPELGWVTAIGGPFRASRMPGYEGLEFHENSTIF